MTLRQSSHLHHRSASIPSTFTEAELRTYASELIEVLADLQRKRIAHRNIKPANIVEIDSTGDKKLRICNFEWAVELENDKPRPSVFSGSDFSPKPKEDQDMIPLNIDACSMVYASPLVLKTF